MSCWVSLSCCLSSSAISKSEFVSQVDPSGGLAGDNLLRAAGFNDLSVIENIGPVTDLKRFAYVVVGYQDPDTALFQMADNVFDIDDGQGIDAGKRLIQQDEGRIDRLAVIDIKNIIGHLKQRGIGVLISDHNVRETLEVCDRAYILNEGQVIEAGSPEEIIASKTARRIYLGDEFRL